LAVVNIIGNSLDYRMPWWSYGHRLYVPVWKNKSNQWEIGWYTHSKGQLYRSWNQSWPFFRRHISLTAKIMCCKKENDIINIENETSDEVEKNILGNNDTLPEHFKSKYLEKGYWKGKFAQNLYWGTIDFKKFYPSVKRTIIIENILKYTKNANEDEDFKILLTNLMAFKIDAATWKEDELRTIDLEPQNFQGLPTGLFVAGFLANVALLAVDEKLSFNLENNREVAHFRFVDDHVVLSYDYDRLKEWIINYYKCLDEANTGAVFNFEKIEPKSLSNALNPEWISDKESNIINAEEIKAKKECSLDPAFPAPLMTQTLARVSAISRSDFEFLSQSEEEQLISDLEHLLLADFPDHELRKDTRISFAASILAQIMPNTKEDYSKVYECQKRIHHKLKNYQKKYETSNNNFVAEKMHELIFKTKTNYDEYFSKWKEFVKNKTDKEERIKAITEIKEEIDKLLSYIKEMHKQTKDKKHRVYKLLNKAIAENPEKVRIWTRIIDYCKKVGDCHIKTVYDKIEFLTNRNIHELSAPYLRALFLSILSDKLMQVVYSVVNNNIISQKEKETTKFFIDDIFSTDILSSIFRSENAENKLYYLKAYEFFRFVLGSAIFALNGSSYRIHEDKYLTEEYNLIDWSNNPNKWIAKTHTKDINAWLYWLLWKTHSKSSSKPISFWKNLQPNIDYSSLTYKALIVPFPNFNDAPQNDRKYLEFILNSNFDEGWLYEVFKTGKNKLTNNIKKRLEKVNLNLYNCIISNERNLWDFIQWQKEELSRPVKEKEELNSFNKYFDPRFSEWTALELVTQIMEIVESADDFFLSNPEKKLHPANFIVPEILMKENIISSWNDWKININTNKIKPSPFQISDERYTTKGLLESERKTGEAAKVHALGIMLLQLITHDFNFPWVWNSTDKSLSFENVLYGKIQNTPLSSFTMLILQACLSSKNREMFAWRKESDNFKSDTAKDVPQINDIVLLKKYVNKAKNRLEKYQLSMENNMPRQLLPVSLEQFSVQNNPFEKQNNMVE